MTNQTHEQNGRVALRDVLEAVNGSETRLAHRIDRLEEKLERKATDHETRITVLETAQAIDAARTRGVVSAVAGIKSFILVAVAVISMGVGVISFMVATEDHAASEPAPAPAQGD